MERKRDTFFLLQNKKTKDQKPFLKENKYNSNVKQKRQQDFDKTHNEAVKEKVESDTKKPFDKKTYRLKKYSKKYKLEQWEEQRKKHLMHQYKKELKIDPVFGSYKPKSFDDDTVDYNQKVGRFVRHPDLIEEPCTAEGNLKNKKDPFGKAKEEFVKVKQDKLKKQQEIEEQKQERNRKMQEYKKKKHERFKKLSKKTKKGQPVMTGRLELLLEKLQNSK